MNFADHDMKIIDDHINGNGSGNEQGPGKVRTLQNNIDNSGSSGFQPGSNPSSTQLRPKGPPPRLSASDFPYPKGEKSQTKTLLGALIRRK